MIAKPGPSVHFSAGTIAKNGIILHGTATFLANSIRVKVLVPSDNSAPQVLEHAPRYCVLTGHEVMELCESAIQHGKAWPMEHALLETHDLLMADDWYYTRVGSVGGYFFSPSLRVTAYLSTRTGRFIGLDGCMVKHGNTYRYPVGRSASALFAKIVLNIAKRKSKEPWTKKALA